MTVQVEHTIVQLIANPAGVQQVIQRDVPMFASDWGAKDEDALVHTLGINLLGNLGRAAGYVGLIEYPVPRARRWQKKLVRVDAAWFDRQTRHPVVLAEFENLFHGKGSRKTDQPLCGRPRLREPSDSAVVVRVGLGWGTN